ncbi:LysR family transcriptional regulator [Metabacillus fastidiosus]|uniref:LysR family transcriptional regulator n=1 Tax=Metabacillus fastidiosus TaxID=1458 RepID=UPI002DB6BB7E|nr:LysR family transcriptional regulator [Metabacillus fastidiosus]MEC2077608.1 LysR family transcriptional regulator [Metabacillus fastidiosus]
MDQQLSVFVTVAEKKNFSRAAEELHMTQPAVSQYIRTLEQTIGTKLLERNNKYVRLNKAGEIVYHHAKEILGLYTKMHDLVDDLTNKTSGSLSIGASYTFGEYVLPHIIADMHKRYPLIHPSIMIGNSKDIAELVKKHQLDVGIIEGELQDKQLTIEPFATDCMYVIASANKKWSEDISIRQLEEETWIVREEGSGTREATERMFQTFGISPQRKLEFGSTQLIKESVEEDLGITLLSESAIRKEHSIGLLKIVQVRELPVTREFSTVLSSPFQTKALQVFLNLVRKK